MLTFFFHSASSLFLTDMNEKYEEIFVALRRCFDEAIGLFFQGAPVHVCQRSRERPDARRRRQLQG